VANVINLQASQVVFASISVCGSIEFFVSSSVFCDGVV